MSTVELRHVRYFIAVAEHLHFGRAANALGLAQPPLSQQIQQLERIVGQQLFVRRPSVSLTAAGEAFLVHARKTLAELERGVDVARRVGEGRAGAISVGFAPSALLSPLADAIRAYRAAQPDVAVSLLELSTADQIDALQQKRIDVAFLRMPPPGAFGIDVEEIHSEPFCVALPPEHRLADRKSVKPSQLRHDPFILFPREVTPNLHDQVQQLFLTAGYRPNVIMEAREWFTIIGLVAAGMGVSIVPATFRRLRWGDVRYPLLAGSSEHTGIFIGTPADENPPALRPFLDVVRNVFKQERNARES